VETLAPIDPAVLALIRGSFGAGGLPMPFVREVFLLECHVAGTSHRALEEVEPALTPGDLLIFQREPMNPVDSLAIRILDGQGRQLGYVPRERNEVIARLLDAGKVIFGKLDGKEWRGRWLKLDLRVFLRDV
jgi:hypothetical protein